MSARRVLRFFLFLLAFFAVIAGGTAIFLFTGEAPPKTTIAWGVNFSRTQTESLGVPWQETYAALLDDLGARRFRLPVYWDELERERGGYDFSSWDWQLEELERRNGTAIVAVGRKLPRWPECRTPPWFDALSQKEQEEALLTMIRVVVERYRDHHSVFAWQVENEPFLHFGLCPKPYPIDLLDREIALVRELDPSRPIVITDTGEFSTWLEAAKRADILGSTMYRVIHDPTVGYLRYPLPPVFYHRKVQWIHLWHPDLRVIFTEAQAEPWVTTPPITAYPVDTQFQTMSPEQFRENIEYLKKTGFDETYLWGAEWWYWLKQNGHPEIWDEAKTLFRAP